MKITLKYLLLFVITGILILGSVLAIFSLNAQNGAYVALAIVVFAAVMFSFSIYGIIKGNLKLFLLRNRFEVVGLMAFSIFLTLFAGFVSLGNVVIEYGLEKQGMDAEDKTRLVASTFLKVPSQKDLVITEKNGIEYFYPEGSESYIDEFDRLIHEEKARFDNLFGEETSEPLTIEIHDNYETLRMGNAMDDVEGYYSMMNQTLYLYPQEESWKEILLHEYTHYRIDQFSETRELKLSRLPQWFQEGLSEYMATREEYHIDYQYLQTVDFNLLDSNESFHETRSVNFNPYMQSYVTVQVLAEEYGEELLLDLMAEEESEGFYRKMEEATGEELEKFQENFLAGKIEERDRINRLFVSAYDALEKRDYDRAESAVKELKEDSASYDQQEADMILKDIYLQKGMYKEAASLLENKSAEAQDWNKVTQLYLLAEVYLMTDTEKALEKIQLALKETGEDGFRNEDLKKFEEALQLILSGQSAAGYKEIYDSGLVMQEKIWQDLLQKITEDYSMEDAGWQN